MYVCSPTWGHSSLLCRSVCQHPPPPLLQPNLHLLFIFNNKATTHLWTNHLTATCSGRATSNRTERYCLSLVLRKGWGGEKQQQRPMITKKQYELEKALPQEDFHLYINHEQYIRQGWNRCCPSQLYRSKSLIHRSMKQKQTLSMGTNILTWMYQSGCSMWIFFIFFSFLFFPAPPPFYIYRISLARCTWRSDFCTSNSCFTESSRLSQSFMSAKNMELSFCCLTQQWAYYTSVVWEKKIMWGARGAEGLEWSWWDKMGWDGDDVHANTKRWGGKNIDCSILRTSATLQRALPVFCFFFL